MRVSKSVFLQDINSVKRLGQNKLSAKKAIQAYKLLRRNPDLRQAIVNEIQSPNYLRVEETANEDGYFDLGNLGTSEFEKNIQRHIEAPCQGIVRAAVSAGFQTYWSCGVQSGQKGVWCIPAGNMDYQNNAFVVTLDGHFYRTLKNERGPVLIDYKKPIEPQFQVPFISLSELLAKNEFLALVNTQKRNFMRGIKELAKNHPYDLGQK